MQQDPYAGIARRDDERDPYEGIARRDEAARAQAGNRFETARQATYGFFDNAADRLEGIPAVGGGASAFVRGVNELALGDRTRSATPGASGVASNGFTWGANNELQGAVAGAVQPIRSAMGERGVSPGQAYVQQSQAARSDLERTRSQAPLASAGLEFLTGAVNPLNRIGVGYIGRGKGLFGGAARTAAVGAPTGMAVGFLEDSGNAVERLDGAAVGGTVGAVAGFTLPVLTNYGARGAQGMSRLAMRSIRKLRQGADMTADEAGAWSMVLREAREAGVSEADILDELNRLQRAGMDEDQAVFELLGGNAVERARGGVAAGDPSALQGRNRINQRQTRQPERVRNSLNEGLGSDGSDFQQAADDLARPTQRETELYSEFRDQPGVERAKPPQEVPLDGPEFQSWFAGSRAVDEAGNPLPVFHGTDRQFSDFDMSAVAGNGRRTQLLGPGHYFTTDAEQAAKYGSRVVEGRLRLRAPRTQVEGVLDGRAGPYDGTIAQGTPGTRDGERVVTALDNSQIAQVANGEARLPGVAGNDALEGFFDNPRFSRIARDAAQDVMDETGQRVNVQSGEVSPALFDAIKRRMDRMINDAEGGAMRATAQSRPLRELRDRFVGFADEAFPNYAPARAEAQQRLSQAEALREGRDIFRAQNTRNPGEVSQRVSSMTPEQQRRYRQGVAAGVMDQVNSAPRPVLEADGRVISSGDQDAPNAIGRFWNRADRQEALRAAFPDESQFGTFADRMAIEQNRSNVFRRVSPRTQGSSTLANARAAAMQDGLQDAADVGTGNWMAPIMRRLQRRARAGDTQLNSEIQRIIWDTVPNQRQNLINALEAERIISNDQARALSVSLRLAAPVTAGAVNATPLPR